MGNKITRAIKSYINKDTFASFGNSLLSLIRGPIIMLLVASFVSETTQGYWYTFGSLSALSTLADLGFGTLVGQFSAHEFSHMSFDKDKKFVGEDAQLDKMSSLFKFVIKWAGTVCIIAFPIIFIIGFFVLNVHGGMSMWLIPWIIYILSSGLFFMGRIVLSFLEGCGQIQRIQVNYLISTIISSIATICMILLKCQLYALVIPSLIGAFVNVILLFSVFRKPLLQICKLKVMIKYNWSKNFLSLIWKYAVSWGCGYLMFQIYTPIAFLADPILAGKVGITMTLVQACFTICNTFNAVLVPKMNMAVAAREWSQAENFMWKGTAFSSALYLLGSVVILFCLGYLIKYVGLFNRFLDVPTVSWLLLAQGIQLIINNIATYGRAHKQEPFLIPSIVGACMTLGGTLLFIKFLPFKYFFLGFALSNCILVVVCFVMYYKDRNKWHNKLIMQQDKENQEIKESIIALGDVSLLKFKIDQNDEESNCDKEN